MPEADPAATAEVLALLQAAAAAREQTAQFTTAAVTTQVRAFTGWWDSVQITRLAQALARIVSAGQRRTATSTDVYAARVLSTMLGQRVGPIGAVDPSTARGGVPLDSVYGRLADEYRWLTATRGPDAPARPGGPPLPTLTPDQVLERIVRRAETMTDTNLTLALREQWSAVTDAAPGRVVGYRRVLHPELATKDGTCGLCVAASDMVYKRAQLMPIHDHCHCQPAPVVGEVGGPGDPGSAINQEDLTKLYEHAGGTTSGKRLRRVHYDVVDHGELGPLLVVRGQHHRGPADVAKAS